MTSGAWLSRPLVAGLLTLAIVAAALA